MTTTSRPWAAMYPLTAEYEGIYRPDSSDITITPHRKGSEAFVTPQPSTVQTASSLAKSSKRLACTSCRKRKVKCLPSRTESDPCRLCQRVGLECITPAIDERKLSNSRRLITELYGRIAALEGELEQWRNNKCPHHAYGKCAPGQHTPEDDANLGDGHRQSPGSTFSNASDSSGSDNMIVRLCGGQRQLNRDRAGRLRFFGPTSSLHLTESVTSTVLSQEPTHRGRYQWQDSLSPELQNHLFDLYWKYQHHAMPNIHKEAFLQDFENGQTKYCSKLLVYCILTRAASISEHPEIRALALAEDETNEDPPFLVSQCAERLEAELDNPGITTLQSLQLLSEIYCVICNDTRGWMDAGGACRLAFELGLHSDDQGLTSASTELSQMEVEVRKIAFWSCFSLDRQWALYLGRPGMIKLGDVSASKPAFFIESSEDLMMNCVWSDLLDIVGVICDALNGVQTTKHRVASIDNRLRGWHNAIDKSFQYHSQQRPALYLLHMQYSAAMILLHRPLANFGSTSSTTPSTEISRVICVHHACLIALYLQHYRECHGEIFTLSWIALHMIATASTTLIANLSEHASEVSSTTDDCASRSGDGTSSNCHKQLSCLQSCVRALNELEKSHLPTRRVRKVIQRAMRMLDLDNKVNTATPLEGKDCCYLEGQSIKWKTLEPTAEVVTFSSTAVEDHGDALGGLASDGQFAMDMAEASMLFDEFLPAGSHMDMLQFESFLMEES